MESRVESHASAARAQLPARAIVRVREAARRLFTTPDAAISLALAAVLASAAFIANGGLQLGSSTFVELGAVLLGVAVVVVAIVAVGFEARLHGGLALAALVALGGLTALSIGWSLYPADSWVETNRTFAYVAVFAAGIAGVRLARERWPAVLAGILLALAAISLWGLATKVAPAWLAPDEVYGRLREPYGYWNAVGVTAAMALPLCLWLGTRQGGNRAVNGLASPLLALSTVTILLSFSRGSIVAGVVGIAIWLGLVPLRLATLSVLLPAGAAAAAVTAWAFSQTGLTDDRVALATRKDAGVELGLILVAMVVVLFVLAIALQAHAERRPLSERARRRIGAAGLCSLALAPVVVLGALAASDRGIGGTVSDRWHDLTKTEAVTPTNSPARLTETASVRSIYWARAVDVWRKHPVTGAGAGSFEQAQLRFRDQPARAKHAHGYPLQTLADLGLVGAAVSLLALIAWILAAARTLALRRRAVRGPGAEWSRERTGLGALALVAVVFGVHSALDWTWFVPAVAMTAMFCAGWVAGRGELGAKVAVAGIAPLEAVRASWPRGPLRRRRVALALPLLAVAILAAIAVSQPWRAQKKGDEALRLVSSGDYPGARAAADRAHDLDPLSPDPYFDLAAVADAGGDEPAATLMLERAVQLEPANPETWRRLGEYYLTARSRPDTALPLLRASLFLDPLSDATRASFIAAVRAQSALRARAALEAQARAERRRARRRGSR
jgi:hypothetical protein